MQNQWVEFTGSFIKSPLGVKTNISSSNISIFNKSINSSGSELSLLSIDNKSLNHDTCESNFLSHHCPYKANVQQHQLQQYDPYPLFESEIL